MVEVERRGREAGGLASVLGGFLEDSFGLRGENRIVGRQHVTDDLRGPARHLEIPAADRRGEGAEGRLTCLEERFRGRLTAGELRGAEFRDPAGDRLGIGLGGIGLSGDGLRQTAPDRQGGHHHDRLRNPGHTHASAGYPEYTVRLRCSWLCCLPRMSPQYF